MRELQLQGKKPASRKKASSNADKVNSDNAEKEGVDVRKTERKRAQKDDGGLQLLEPTDKDLETQNHKKRKNSTKKPQQNGTVTKTEEKKIAKEQAAKKKVAEAERNSVFLQSLAAFKQKTKNPNDVSETTDKTTLQLAISTTISPVKPAGAPSLTSTSIFTPTVTTTWTSTPVASPSGSVWNITDSLGHLSATPPPLRQNYTPIRPKPTMSREWPWCSSPVQQQLSCGDQEGSFISMLNRGVPQDHAELSSQCTKSPSFGTLLKEATMTLTEPTSFIDMEEQSYGFSDINYKASSGHKASPGQSSSCLPCKQLQEDVRKLQEQLSSAKREIVRLREIKQQGLTRQNRHLNEIDNEMRLQQDGKPRAGFLSQDIAQQNKMVELMPGSSVYVYPATLREVQKIESQTAKARNLLSAFYTNAELVVAGNLTGANGKKGLDDKVVTAIVEYAALHGVEKASEIRSSMRRKISALTSYKANKENTSF